MAQTRKDQVRELLKSIETGDPAPIAVVNQEQYIQHNPQTSEGSDGLEALFKRLSKTSPRVNIVRAFEDGDYVFAHTEYDFANSTIGFEVFRFDGEHIVEHWDNIQKRQGPNASGRTMVDGPTVATDHALTETNRKFVDAFVRDILIGRQLEKLEGYITEECFMQHNPQIKDGLLAFCTALDAKHNTSFAIDYGRSHRVLAEGNFVLSVCEGSLNGIRSSFYDLLRVDEGKIVEHWGTIEAIPPRHQWKNDNGKF